MLASWTGWHIRRNEVVCQYEFHLSDPLIMQIHLTVEEDFMGMGPLHKFLHVLAYPCPIPAADSTLDGIAFRTQDGIIDTGCFPVLSTRAERNGSLVINVPSQEKVTDCLKVLSSGKNMFLGLAIAGAVYDFPLKNDGSFQECFVKCQLDVLAAHHRPTPKRSFFSSLWK